MKFSLILDDTRYMQYLSATIATLSMTSYATYMGWASPTLPQLTSENSPIGVTITDSEGSWVASSFLLGSILGGFLSGWLVERFGRKKSLLMSAVPLILPWIAIIFAKSALVLYIARFIAGIGLPVVITGAAMYNGEIAEKDIRGKLGTTFNILKLTGHLFVLSVGPFVSYTVFAISCSAFPIAFAILFCFMPESPYYLVKVGKEDEARRNLIRLSSTNSNNKIIEERLEEIKSTVNYDMKNRSTLWELFSKQEYRKSLIVMTGIKTIQQLCGTTAIDSYIQTIIGSSKTSISPEISSIICGVVQFPAAFAAAALVDRMGRKPLMFISALGCAFTLFAEGIYFYLLNVVKSDVSGISWLPTTALLSFLVMNSLGLNTLSWVLLGELFATNIKGIAVGAFTVYASVLAFLVTKFFQPISNQWGMHVTFWIFGSVCILGAMFSVFVLPETKGKTFGEIQEKLNRHNRVKQKEDTEL